MSLPLLIAFIVAQGQAAQTQQPFSAPFPVAEPNRIAMTPKIDGRLDDEEWDPLSNSAGMKSFFQWEPGKFYIAAVVPNGHDVVASFDLKANGWLIGKDNLEIKISSATGAAAVTARILDGTGIAGPQWIDLPGFSLSSIAASSTDGTNTTFEACIADDGLGLIPLERGTKLMMRVDAPLSTDPPAPAYLPRALSPIALVYDRSAAFPSGLTFKPEGNSKTSVAGDSTHIRLGFNGTSTMKLQRLEMHSEGFSKNDTNQMAVPFPPFDSHGRSYTDYNTGIAAGSPEGYRVLKGTLTTPDGISAVLECSYRIGPIVEFDIPHPNIPISKTDRSIKLNFYIKSNSSKKVTGTVALALPDPLRVLNGPERKIGIYTNRGQDRDTFDVFIPANSFGTYPIKFSAVINGKKFDQVKYFTVGGI